MKTFLYPYHKAYDEGTSKEKFTLFIVPLIYVVILDEAIGYSYPFGLGYLTIFYLIFIFISRFVYLKMKD